MTSEAAKKAFPDDCGSGAYFRTQIERAAFDRGAVEAFRQAAGVAEELAAKSKARRDESDYPDSRIGAEYHGLYHGANDVAVAIDRLIENWEVGQ